MNRIILKLIRIYQNFLSPISGMIFGSSSGCRFYPTCSHYTYEAVEKFGFRKGLTKGAYRILRCNPLSQGGVDPVV